MEPAYLRAMLARTPGLLAKHLAAIDPPLTPQLLPRLLAGDLPARARAWLSDPDHHLIDADLRWIEANEGEILCSFDAGFPASLAALDWAPAALYLSGSRDALRAPRLAIVGSRQASPAGCDTARRFAAELAAAGVGIVGGLGEGIDVAAHEGALAAAGRTIGVYPRGLDRTYPAEHAALAARIRGSGCLLSGFAPGSPPRRHHFPIRDRLIWALGCGTLVVEARAGSGLLATAGQFRSGNRPLFAIPGSIRDPQAQGCNGLIRAGARLVQHPSELLQELNVCLDYQIVTPTARPSSQRQSGSSPLDNKYEMLLDAAGFEPVDIDVLAFRTGWSGHTVASMLLLLELRGRIAPQPGGRYCRLS